MRERLDERQERLLRRMPAQQRAASIGGVALVLAGALYVGWAVQRFSPHGDPALEPAFDRPVMRPILNGYGRYRGWLSRYEAETPGEARLASGLQTSLRFGSGVMVLSVRVLLGTIVAMLGLAALTVAVERRRLLHIIETLAPSSAPAPPPDCADPASRPAE